MHSSIPQLLDKLVGLLERESGGGTASNRFRYQHYWTIDLLISEAHAGREFVVLCEHHEDVLLIRVTQARGCVHLFQVKTRQDPVWKWSASRLAQRKGKKPSALGNCIASLEHVPIDEVIDLTFVSNRSYKLTRSGEAKPTEHTRIRLIDVGGACRTKLDSKLTDERGAPPTDHARSRIVLARSDLDTRDDQFIDLVRSRLSNYVEELYETDAANVGPLLRALHAEISRLSSVEAPVEGTDELLAKKAITSEQFRRYCQKARIRRRSHQDWWPMALEDLRGAGLGPILCRKIGLAVSELEVHRISPTYLRMVDDALVTVRLFLETADDDLCMADILKQAGELVLPGEYDDPIRRPALVLMSLYDDEEAIQTTHSRTSAGRT